METTLPNVEVKDKGETSTATHRVAL